MDSIQKQLADIRSEILTQSGDESHQKDTASAIKKNISKRGKETEGLSVYEQQIAWLPRHGFIDSYDADRGFGFVRAGGSSYFFHVTDNFLKDSSSAKKIKPDEPILYLIGASPKDGRKCAVRWCLPSQIDWHGAEAPDSQKALDSLRIEWLAKQPVERLLRIQHPPWYPQKAKSGETLEFLNDPILKGAITGRLKPLSPDDWQNLQVAKLLTRGRYNFSCEWNTEDKAFSPSSLLSYFTADQLSTLGPPQYGWVSMLKPDQVGNLFEWALLAELDSQEIPLWQKDLQDGFDWDREVATRLIQSCPHINQMGLQWISELIKRKSIETRVIRDRLSAFPDEWSTWIPALPPQEQAHLIDDRAPNLSDRLQLLTQLGNNTVTLNYLSVSALSLDLESDGESIWEIGVAIGGQRKLLYSTADNPSSLDLALQSLLREIEGAPLIIGHNIIEWDWPIISRITGKQESPLIWDTMLVGFMLEPWLTSHALGGSHRADEDAMDAMSLFTKQLAILGGTVALQILAGEITDTESLFQALGEALLHTDWQLPALERRWKKLIQKSTPDSIHIASHRDIAQLSWVPGVELISVCADGALSGEFNYLDARAWRASGADPSPACTYVLGAVIEKFEGMGVACRVGLLPIWLRENEEVRKRIDVVATPQCPLSSQFKIAPYPEDPSWYGIENIAKHVFINPPARGLLIKKGYSSWSELPGNITSRLVEHQIRADAIYMLDEKPVSNTIECFTTDVVARRLSTNHRFYRSGTIVELSQHESVIVPVSVESKAEKCMLAVSEGSKFYPGGENQDAYWRQVLRDLKALLASEEIQGVTILLVTSTSSEQLIAIVERELGIMELAAPQAEHYSRRERLVRAGENNHRCVVDVVENWPAWRAVSISAGVRLVPIIEALPLADWYCVSSQRDSTTLPGNLSGQAIINAGDNDDTGATNPPINVNASGESGSPEEGLPIVTNADIVQAAPTLVGDNFDFWLGGNGLGETGTKAYVLDSRLNPLNPSIRSYFDVCEIKSTGVKNFSEERPDISFPELAVNRSEAPTDYEDLRQFLEGHWNSNSSPRGENRITDFREKTQRPALDVIRLATKDVLVTLPTGEGKSVLFQVPTLFRGGFTRRLSIVISPLRALMRDQVENLARIGFLHSVDYLSGDRSVAETEDVFQGILDNRIILLYVAPERFRSRRFLDALRQRYNNDRGLEFVVFDEVHCVSQWGYEFRPDYFHAFNLLCREFRQHTLGAKSPFLLFSATVTKTTQSVLETLLSGGPDVSASANNALDSQPSTYFHPIREFIELGFRDVQGKIAVRPKEDWPIEPRINIIEQAIEAARDRSQNTGAISTGIIFVTQRDHAEVLCARLSDIDNVKADFFHAGLDSESRVEIYEQFRRGELDVLVATKAFGMGMDIPHIHWVVHLAPPTFLEDYLQEVGRIGRGEESRKQAGLDKLDAILLSSGEDFEVNRENVLRSKIEFPALDTLLKTIKTEAKSYEEGRAIAVMPEEGYDHYTNPAKRRAAITFVRKQIYWLERVGQLSLKDILPGILPVRLYPEELRKLASPGEGPRKEVARLLLSLYAGGPGDASDQHNVSGSRRAGLQPAPASLFDHIFSGLTRFIGFVFGMDRKDTRDTAVRPPPKPSDKSALSFLNLGQIWQRTSLHSMDELLSLLTELSELHVLTIERSISFSLRRIAKIPASEAQIDSFFTKIETVALDVIRQLDSKREATIDLDNPLIDTEELLFNEPNADDAKSLEWSVAFLLRRSGIKVHEQHSRSDRSLWLCVSVGSTGEAVSRVKTIVKTARYLWGEFASQIRARDHVIQLSALIDAVKRSTRKSRYREKDLRHSLGLLAKMQLVSSTEPMVPMCYVLDINENVSELSEDHPPEVWDELKEHNQLTELRADAFEIFSHVTPQAQDEFIQGYFECAAADELDGFLESQLGFVDDSATDFVKGKLEHLRAEKINAFFDRFRGEDGNPQQWRAISQRYSDSYIVNAGPGSGKTTVLVARICHLIREQNLRPENILVLAFNRAVVLEIRRRVRELFQSLGYGNYVRQLKVYTFHGFAKMLLSQRIGYDASSIRDMDLLAELTIVLAKEPNYLEAHFSSVQAVLVDEFQDVNDQIFTIIEALGLRPNQQRSVMAIGDDDQDILRWNRSNGEFAQAYFERFKQAFIDLDKAPFSLSLNYRSGAEIVSRATNLLSKFFENHATLDKRLKTVALEPAHRSPSAQANITGKSTQLEACLQEIISTLQEENSPGILSTALLCRGNDEVAFVFSELEKIFPDVVVYNNEQPRIASLRHIACWLDILISMSSGSRPLTDQLRIELLAQYNELDIPESRRESSAIASPEDLWDLAQEEQSWPTISNLIELIQNMDVSDLKRVTRTHARTDTSITVSTIHKVKGLEFDSVHVMPSTKAFPLTTNAKTSFLLDAAEEARLYYVAMTRARTRLTCYWGQRENAWFHAKEYRADRTRLNKVLSGSPEEVFISWGWLKTAYHQDPGVTQNYIKTRVRIGDKIFVQGGQSLLHQDGKGRLRPVGRLSSKAGSGNQNSCLKVSSVIRYDFDENVKFKGVPSQEVFENGYGWVILVSGTLL